MSASSMGMEILAELRNERTRQGLSKTDMAERLGIARSSFSRLEDGYSMPLFPTLLKWAACLGLSIRVVNATVQDG